MNSLQELKQQASHLTIDEKRELGRFLLEQAERDAQVAAASSVPLHQQLPVRTDRTRLREQQWLKENWQQYLDEWVCLEGDQLISHSTDGRRVFEEAKAAGITAPFIVQVEDPTLPQMGGLIAHES